MDMLENEMAEGTGNVITIKMRPRVRHKWRQIGRIMAKLDNDTAFGMAAKTVACLIAERVKQEHWARFIDCAGEMVQEELKRIVADGEPNH